jgi:hypothetical protein
LDSFRWAKFMGKNNPSSMEFFLSQSPYIATQMVEHVIVDCEIVMQCDCMPHWPPQVPISEWPQNIDYLLNNDPFILCGNDWLGITACLFLEPLTGEFSSLVGLLKQLQCGVSMWLRIPHR